MYSSKYPHLFSPIILANTYFKNRIFASPQGTSHSTYGNLPTEQTIAFYERKAMGGAAAVCVGDAVVDSEIGMGNGPHFKLDCREGSVHLNRMARDINKHGAVSSIELNHCGSSARRSFEMGHTIYGAVATRTDNFHSVKNLHAEEMPPEIILCRETGRLRHGHHPRRPRLADHPVHVPHQQPQGRMGRLHGKPHALPARRL